MHITLALVTVLSGNGTSAMVPVVRELDGHGAWWVRELDGHGSSMWPGHPSRVTLPYET